MADAAALPGTPTAPPAAAVRADAPDATSDRPPHWRGRLRAMPLRHRLVAILVLLALVALALTGAAAIALLRQQLVAKVDDQLRLTASQAVQFGTLPDPTDDGATRRGQLPTATYGVVILDSGVYARFENGAGTMAGVPDLTALHSVAAAKAMDGKAETLPLAGDDGACRVFVKRVTVAGYGSGTLVVGQSLRDVDDTVTRLSVVLVVVALVVLVAVGGLGGLVVRRALRPLTEVEGVAEGIAGGDLTRRVPDHPTSTEVGRLSASLNAMLAQIEQSFALREASEERMRRFVSDASHELRTPLAAVRGYAELYRQGAVTDPDDVAGAMRRIEDEATRMGGLVEDLLLLARLDEQRADKRQPVDLTVVAADAVQDARALDPSRTIRLVGRAGELGPVVVLGDEARLRQVVTNLVANALRHTPAGSPVELALGTEDRAALLEVRDHGPGIAPDQVRQVFERFFRADASRRRGQGGGSGLGLAIVAAILNAHRGQVGVTRTPGGGATFVVRLPLADDAATA